MMIERTMGGYFLRYDPVLVARAIELRRLRRPEIGDVREAPKKRRRR